MTILVIINSDTLVDLLAPVAVILIRMGKEVVFKTLKYTNENAHQRLKQFGFGLLYRGKLSIRDIFTSRYDAILIGNDWGAEIISIIHLCNVLRIPSFCIQESTIDLSNKPPRRLQHAFFVFLMGTVSSKLLNRSRNVFICGNPRYEKVSKDHHVFTPGKSSPVLVNLNFTYNIETNHAESWLSSVLHILDICGMPHAILRHPRDMTDIRKFRNRVVINTTSASISHYLSSASIVITRFSSLVHETLLLGIPVVYFDPYREPAFYDFTPDSRVLYYVNTPEQLMKRLRSLVDFRFVSADFDSYLDHHLAAVGEESATLIASKISNIVQNIRDDTDFYSVSWSSSIIKIFMFFSYSILALTKYLVSLTRPLVGRP